MAQPGTPLTDGQLANFVGEVAKAATLIAPHIGATQVARWSTNNSHSLQVRLIQALGRQPVLQSRPQQVEFEAKWQVADEDDLGWERVLKSLEDTERFEITGFGQRLFDLARALPRSTGRMEYTLCTPYQLGVRQAEYYHQLISWIMAHHQLQLCTMLAGPIICATAAYREIQPSLFVAMQPLAYLGCRRNIELGFKLGCKDGKRVLDARPVRNLIITPHQPMLFALRPS